MTKVTNFNSLKLNPRVTQGFSTWRILLTIWQHPEIFLVVTTGVGVYYRHLDGRGRDAVKILQCIGRPSQQRIIQPNVVGWGWKPWHKATDTIKPEPGSRRGLIVQVGSCQLKISVRCSSWIFALTFSECCIMIYLNHCRFFGTPFSRAPWAHTALTLLTLILALLGNH